jgi:hypothetical protein
MKRHVEIFENFERAFDNIYGANPLIEKKKVDQDGDGDTDFVDAKIAQYQKGGIKKGQAIAKAKMFAKKNNIKDSNPSIKEGFWNRWTKPTIDQAAHDSVKGQGHSHRGKDDGEYIMFDGQKFSQDEIEYADYHDTGRLPRIENGVLIIANPNWNL